MVRVIGSEFCGAGLGVGFPEIRDEGAGSKDEY